MRDFPPCFDLNDSCLAVIHYHCLWHGIAFGFIRGCRHYLVLGGVIRGLNHGREEGKDLSLSSEVKNAKDRK